MVNAPVAQLDRVQPSEGWGRTFESCLARHFLFSFIHDMRIYKNIEVVRMEKDFLLLHMDEIHTTKRGVERIKRNLSLFTLDDSSIIPYCKQILLHPDCHVVHKGKNFYCQFNTIQLVIHATCYTIITAHLMKS